MSDYVLHNHLVEEYVRARPGDRVSVVRVRLVLRVKGRAETALLRGPATPPQEP